MSITTRFAPDVEEQKETFVETLTEIIESSGARGLQGLQGPPGEDGADGADATTKPPKYINLPGSGNITISAGQGTCFRVNLDDDCTVKFAGWKDGEKFSVAFTQDGGGFTVTWPAGVKWVGGSAPTMTSTDGKRDVYGFERWKNGSEDGYDGFVIGQSI